MSALFGHTEVAKLLVHAKSDVAARDGCGECACRARVRCCATKPHALPCRNGDTPLKCANRYGRSYVVAFLRSAVDDALAPFRGKNLKVKRSSGAIEGGWQLAAGAQVDASGLVELRTEKLTRSMWFDELMQLNNELLLEQARIEQFEVSGAAPDVKELMQLNSELVRVARGELTLTREEILAGLG
jgi:hypothetical protein